MTEVEREKYHDYANQIANAVANFHCHEHWREKRIAKAIKAGKVRDHSAYWWRLTTESERRLVLKIVRIVEEFE